MPHASKLILPALVVGASFLAPASALATGDACQERLNPDRRAVYKYTSGQRTLGFGQVVVQATAADRHRYCIKVQFGGRTPLNAFGQSTDVRRDGKWVQEGGLGDGFAARSGYTRSVEVRDRSRINLTYSIKRSGRVYSTITIRRFNL